MTVGRICQREVDVAELHETAQVAAQRMLQRQVGTLIVIDAQRHPIGILTDRDLAMKVVAHARDATETVVQEVMTPNPRVAGEDTPIEEALVMMRGAAVRRLPVVDGERRLCGIVSLDDVLGLIGEEFQHIVRLIEREGPRGLGQ